MTKASITIYMLQRTQDAQIITTSSEKALISMVSFFCGISVQAFGQFCLFWVGSHFLTTPHDLHRRRRKPLEPFFSRLGVVRLEPMLHEVVGKLTGRLEALKGTQSLVRLDHVFFAFAGDVIGKVCCEEREDFLDDPDFAPQWSASLGSPPKMATVINES